MSASLKKREGVYKLTDLEISFVSTCPKGANPGAKIILKKEAEMPGEEKKEEQGKDININIDIESLSKSLTENLKTSLESILTKEDLSKDAMAEAVIAMITGDLEKMQKSLQEQFTKSIDTVQKEVDAKIAKAKEAKVEKDETIEINGVSFNKSDIGIRSFEVIKASYMEQQKLRKEIEHTKMVARVEKEYPNVAGKPEEKAELLELLEKSSAPVKALGLSMLKSLNEKTGEMMKEYGGGSHRDGSNVGKFTSDTEASLKLQKMAEEIAKKDNISVASAWEKAVDTPEGGRLYDEHYELSNKE